MTRRTKWVIISTALLFWVMGTVYLWNSLCWPYEKMPEWSPAEKKIIKKAQERHGHFTVIRITEGAYIRRDGEIVWIIRTP